MAEYNWRSDAHELRSFFASPTVEEIEDVHSGTVELALGSYHDQDVLVLFFRIGRQPWSGAPYTWHMVPSSEQTLPPGVSGEERAILNIVLVDTDTGLVLALRTVTMPPEFSRTLHEQITAQAARPFKQSTYDWQLRDLYKRYPTTSALLETATARCVAGRP